ncbi:MAG: SUMF1/EgtB/PvdO family nonheme iron enzyme [Proteobacteria bacterium]|nr:SUMF1/EgtB/PvdO family nonheme iron enzyme [Pseudomonadota bacterium]
MTIFLLPLTLSAGCDFVAENNTPQSASRPGERDGSTALTQPGAADPFPDDNSARPIGKPDLGPDSDLELAEFSLPHTSSMVRIPGGTLLAGSPPSDTRRVQFAENDMIPSEMTSFEIDALPFPNDLQHAFLTGVTREEAAAACQNQGKRLCTELEWEWACKSAANFTYPTGYHYNPSSYAEQDRTSPVSQFGVFAMGRMLEWTSSAWGKEPDQIERTVARGYAPDFGETPMRGRRCAKRWRFMPDASDARLGFRCCRGSVNEAECTIEPPRPPHSLYKRMKPHRFAQIIQSIPQLVAIHDNPHMFSDGDVRTVLARRGNDRQTLAARGIHFHWKPIRWIPRQGMELWVAIGRSNRHAFIVALHETKDNMEYVHASSLILWDQPIPLALAYRDGHRDALFWAPCWNCRDGGKIAFDDEKNEVIITHKW